MDSTLPDFPLHPWPPIVGRHAAAGPVSDPRGGDSSALDPRHDEQPGPAPLRNGDLDGYRRRRGAGAPFKDNYEALLRELPAEVADRLTQLQKESRAAWLFELPRGEQALLVGNALSGLVQPLASVGFQVTLLDPWADRAELALDAAEAVVPTRVRRVPWTGRVPLPFGDRSFDLVIDEELPTDRSWLDELRRVCDGELLVQGDNRWGYKRSSGRYWDYRVPGPIEYLREGLAPGHGERSLGAYRRSLSDPEFAEPRAYALYPHRRDFAHVVALDASHPSLCIGPAERRNPPKIWAQRLGLFRHLTPSFALLLQRRERIPLPVRIDTILTELAERIGEPAPRAEHLIGTRGNTALIQTRLPGASPEDPRGRWTLHVPLCVHHGPALDRHIESLRRVAEQFPEVPVPEALFAGELDGVWLTCERRLGGEASHHWIGAHPAADRLIRSASKNLAALVTRATTPLDSREFAELVEDRLEVLLRGDLSERSKRALEALVSQAKEVLLGSSLPRMLVHGDLRAKHVQATSEGQPLGYLDWGTARGDDLPGYDLVHLLVHNRKQRHGERDDEAWRKLRERRGIRPSEREALEGYFDSLGIDEASADALLSLYPLFVGHTAEAHWPFSRPAWFEKHFDLDAEA